MLHCFDPLTRLWQHVARLPTSARACPPLTIFLPFSITSICSRGLLASLRSAQLTRHVAGLPTFARSILQDFRHLLMRARPCLAISLPPPALTFSVASIRSGSHGMLQLPTFAARFWLHVRARPRLTVFLPWLPNSDLFDPLTWAFGSMLQDLRLLLWKEHFLPSIGLHPLRVLAVPTVFDVPGRFGAIHPRGPDFAPHIALDPRLDCFDPFTRALVACCKTSDIYSCVPASPFPSQANFSPFITVGGPSHKFFTSDICSGKSTFLYICPLKTRILAVPTVFDVPGRFGAIHPRGPDFAAHIALDATLDHFDPLTRDFGNMLQDLRHLLRKEHFLVHLPTNNTSPRCSHRLRRPRSLWGYPSPWPDFVAHITLIPSGLVHHALRRVYRPDVDLHVAPTVADVVAAAQSQFLSFAPESLLPPPPPSPSPLRVTLGLYTPHEPSTAAAAAPLMHELRMKVATAHNATTTPPATTDKFMALVCDNASNNDTMVTELELLLPNFGGGKFRVWCFAHVLNLVVKAVLSQFAKTAQVANLSSPEDDKALAALELVDDEEVMEDAEDVEEVTAAVTTTHNNTTNPLDRSVQDSDLAAIQQVVDDTGYDERMPVLTCQDINLGCFAIFKLRTLVFKISNSPTI
ncbi:hypothetical protein EDB85DRAFT_2155935 [Lactarius pseudohatsudake]|nr:hypothetical protein EDB85DRAFT_2155935 [Lactarius pseudohatsudake]